MSLQVGKGKGGEIEKASEAWLRSLDEGVKPGNQAHRRFSKSVPVVNK